MIAPTLQRLALCFLLLCSVVVPAAAAEVAANVLVGMLASANIGAGVPAGWPRAQRRVEDAKMLLDVEKVKMLPWQIGLLNRKLGTQAGLEQRCLRGGGQAPEGSMPTSCFDHRRLRISLDKVKESLLQAIRPRVSP